QGPAAPTPGRLEDAAKRLPARLLARTTIRRTAVLGEGEIRHEAAGLHRAAWRGRGGGVARSRACPRARAAHWHSRRCHRRGRSGGPAGHRRLPAGDAIIGLDNRPHLQVEYRWGLADPAIVRKHAAELVNFADVILSSGTASLGPLLQETRTVPIVFVNVADPVGAGFVNSLSRPGGNATGFMQFEYSLSAKWLELLKQIAPGVTRAAVVGDGAAPFASG